MALVTGTGAPSQPVTQVVVCRSSPAYRHRHNEAASPFLPPASLPCMHQQDAGASRVLTGTPKRAAKGYKALDSGVPENESLPCAGGFTSNVRCDPCRDRLNPWAQR